MAKGPTVSPEYLGAAITRELTLYQQESLERINNASQRAAEKLVKLTKANAPVGARGKFKSSIASKLFKSTLNGDTYVWYVRAPAHRLTHLLAHGHATRNGGRTRANPFLADAVNEVLREYEIEVEAILSGK